MFLVEIEARAARLHLAADRGRNAAPRALDLGEVLGDRADRAVLLDQAVDHVVERLETFLVDPDVPVAMRHDVVAGAGSGFGGRGQLVLLALRGDVVDVHLDLVLVAPLLGELVEGLVGARHPVVPHTHRDRAGGVGAVHVGGSDDRGGGKRSGFQNVATCSPRTH